MQNLFYKATAAAVTMAAGTVLTYYYDHPIMAAMNAAFTVANLAVAFRAAVGEVASQPMKKNRRCIPSPSPKHPSGLTQ
jgi:hypothetical protein